jgi:hypothetical protein
LGKLRVQIFLGKQEDGGGRFGKRMAQFQRWCLYYQAMGRGSAREVKCHGNENIIEVASSVRGRHWLLRTKKGTS